MPRTVYVAQEDAYVRTFGAFEDIADAEAKVRKLQAGGMRDAVIQCMDVQPSSNSKPQCPEVDWGSAWAELRGYVQEAATDCDPFPGEAILAFMDELRARMREPVKEWMRQIGGNEN